MSYMLVTFHCLLFAVYLFVFGFFLFLFLIFRVNFILCNIRSDLKTSIYEMVGA